MSDRPLDMDALWLRLDESPDSTVPAQAWAEGDAEREAIAAEASEILADLRRIAPALVPGKGFAEKIAARVAADDRARGRRSLLGFVAAAVLLISAIAGIWRFAVTPAVPKTEPGLALALSKGSITIERAGAAHSLGAAAPLRPGDRIDASADLDLSGPAGRLALSTGTRFTWLEDASPDLHFRLEQGRLFSSIKPAPARLSIATPAGTVEVTGTEFILDVPPPGAADPSVFLVVREGSVRFTNAHGSVDVAAGWNAWMTPEAAPQAVRCPADFLAATFLWTVTDSDVRGKLGEFVEKLDDSGRYAREMAISRMQRAALDMDDVAGRLAAFRADPRPRVRAAIFRILLTIEGPGWADVLREALSDPDPAVARECLAECDRRDRRPVEAVRLALGAPDTALRIDAIRIVRARHLAEFAADLERLKASPDRAEAAAALDALESLRK